MPADVDYNKARRGRSPLRPTQLVQVLFNTLMFQLGLVTLLAWRFTDFETGLSTCEEHGPAPVWLTSWMARVTQWAGWRSALAEALSCLGGGLLECSSSEAKDTEKSGLAYI